MKKVGILTSGGDAPGMNACIRAVVRGCLFNGMDVYGIRQGYEGLLAGDFERMDIASVADIIHRGGTMLQTARCDEFKTQEGISSGAHMLKRHGITDLVVIGGDGTITGGKELYEASGVPVYGLPGTIDNDCGFTDFTIGFDTAVNTVLSAIGNIRDTSSSHGRTTIIEVMGRHCGDIALHAGLAGGAETILVPEVPYSVENIGEKLLAGMRRGKKHSIIIKAEGVDIPSQELADKLAQITGSETKCVILGYIQRGGSPTARDRILASRMGCYCADMIAAGSKGGAIGIRGDSIVDYSLEEALNMEKKSHLDFQKICDILS